MAVFLYMARIMVAGPFMLMEYGSGLDAQSSNPAVQNFHVIQGSDAHSRVSHLAVNIGPPVRIVSVKGNGIKSR